MKKFLLSIFILTLCLFATADGVRGQSGGVSDEEYEIFSVYINHVYLNLQNDWYRVSGEKSKMFEHLKKIEQVVVGLKTVPARDFKFENAPYFSQIPKELVANLLEQNKEAYQLTGKFETNVEQFLFQRNFEELQFAAQEMIRRNVEYDIVFLEKYPKAAGYINLFRPGFDAERKNALLALYRIDVYTNWKSPRRGPQENMVLLSKENNRWVVKKIFPGDYGRKIDLRACQPASQGSWLPLGSNSFKVKGLENGKCHISEFNEIEGGYSQVECLIPTSLDEFYVMGGEHFIYSKNLSAYCQKPKTGNIFFDRIQNLPAPQKKKKRVKKKRKV